MEILSDGLALRSQLWRNRPSYDRAHDRDCHARSCREREYALPNSLPHQRCFSVKNGDPRRRDEPDAALMRPAEGQRTSR